MILFSCNERKLRKNEVIMGDFTNVDIIQYDTIVAGGYYAPISYSIDLDNDGVDDIQFACGISGSPAVGMIPYASVTCLHQGIQFLGYERNDTSFLNIDTSSYVDGYGVTVLVTRYNYSCEQISDDDSILSITPTFKLTPLENGDKITIEDTFKSDTVTLYSGSYGYPADYYQINEDTAMVEQTYFYRNCISFPQESVKYIGVRFADDSRLGWIKVNLFGSYKILVLESAIVSK